MRKIIILAVALCLLGIWLSSCKKDDPVVTSTTDSIFTNQTVVSDTPSISFVAIAPTTVQEYKDSINITIAYLDGDGDLGENTAGVNNLFLTDNRNDVTYKFRVPQLGPDTTVAISGELTITLNNTAITDNSNSQEVTYSLYVTDRAGNESNTITATPITVTP